MCTQTEIFKNSINVIVFINSIFKEYLKNCLFSVIKLKSTVYKVLVFVYKKCILCNTVINLCFDIYAQLYCIYSVLNDSSLSTLIRTFNLFKNEAADVLDFFKVALSSIHSICKFYVTIKIKCLRFYRFLQF